MSRRSRYAPPFSLSNLQFNTKPFFKIVQKFCQMADIKLIGVQRTTGRGLWNTSEAGIRAMAESRAEHKHSLFPFMKLPHQPF